MSEDAEVRAAIVAAIETLEAITFDDIGQRFAAYKEDVNLNRPDRGAVQATLNKLHAALAKAKEKPDV